MLKVTQGGGAPLGWNPGPLTTSLGDLFSPSPIPDQGVPTPTSPPTHGNSSSVLPYRAERACQDTDQGTDQAAATWSLPWSGYHSSTPFCPKLGSPHRPGKSRRASFYKESSPSTHTHTLGSHPAPFSPASQHEEFLLPLSLHPPALLSPHLVTLQHFPLPLRRVLFLA